MGKGKRFPWGLSRRAEGFAPSTTGEVWHIGALVSALRSAVLRRPRSDLGGQIDGVVDGVIAVEVESRVAKQIRGAVLDLICHSCAKKLLIILPVHASNPTVTAAQCRNILVRFVSDDNFRVVVAEGSGDNERLAEDAILIRVALQELGFSTSA